MTTPIFNDLEVHDTLEIASTGAVIPVEATLPLSEIIFPNQVLAEVDWANPDTTGLLTCVFNDGVNVTDCITGEVGASFDSINELGTNSGLSATWLGGKPEGIDDNPLSLLMRHIDEETRYQIILPYDRNTMKLQYTDTTNDTKDCEIEFEVSVKPNGSNSDCYVVGANGSAQYHVYLSRTAISFGLQGVAVTFSLNESLPTSGNGVYHRYKLKLKGGSVQAWQNDVELSVLSGTATGKTQGFRLYDGTLMTPSTGVGVSSTFFKFIAYDFPSDSRYWDFNKESGDVVYDLINNQPLTLTGFPSDIGYLLDEQTNIIGYRTNGAQYAENIPFTLGEGDYIEFKIRTTHAVYHGLSSRSGYSNYIRIGSNGTLRARGNSATGSSFTPPNSINLLDGQWHTIRLTLTATKHYFTVDGIDTGLGSGNVSGNFDRLLIATAGNFAGDIEYIERNGVKLLDFTQGDTGLLTNTDPIKWQSIAHQHTYYIGAGQDFETLEAHRVAQRNLDDSTHELILKDNVSLTSTLQYASGEFAHLVYRGDKAFNGILQHVENRSLRADGAMSSPLIHVADKLDIYDVDILSSPSSSPFTLDAGARLSIDRVGLESAHACLYANNNTIFAANSKIVSAGDYAAHDGSASSNLHLSNCDLHGHSANGAVRNQYGVMTMRNNIVRNANGTSAIVSDAGNLKGSHNVTQDTTHAAGTMTEGIQATLARNSDDFIDSGSLSALKGKGWNGVDIVGWAHSQEAAANIALDIDSLSIACYVDSPSIIRTTALGFDSLNVSLDIDGVDVSRTTDISIDSLAISSHVDVLNITRNTVVTVDSLSLSSSIDEVPILSNIVVTIDSLSITSSIDDVSLSRTTALTIDDVSIDSAISSPTIAVTHQLTVDGLVLASQIDDALIDRTTLLTIDSLACQSAIDEVSLSTNTLLSVEPVIITSAANDVNIARTTQLSVDNGAVSLAIDEVSLSTNTLLSVDSGVVQASIDSVDIARTTTLVCDDLILQVDVGNVSLSTNALLSVDSLAVDCVVDSPALTNRVASLSIDSLNVATDVDEVAVARTTSLEIDALAVDIALDSLFIGVNALLSIDDVVVESGADETQITRYTTIDCDDLNCDVAISQVNLFANSVLVIHGVSVASSIEHADILRQTNLTIDELTVNTALSDADADRIIALDIHDLSSKIAIDDVLIERTTALQVDEPVIDTYISSVSVVGEFSLQIDGAYIDTVIDDGNVYTDPFSNSLVQADAFITQFRAEKFILDQIIVK